MSAALIIINLIEEMLSAKGRYNHCREHAMEQQIIARTNAAAAYARVRKIPVIWVKTGFSDDYHDIPRFSPLYNRIKQMGALRLSTPACDWVAGLEVLPEDHQVVKKAVSAFAGNQLIEWLREHHCHHLLLAGMSTSLTIESTARHAHDEQFQVSLLQDLCAASTVETHQQSLYSLQEIVEITSSNVWMK